MPAVIVGVAIIVLTQIFTFLVPAPRRRRGPGGLARIGVRGAGLAVVLVPGAALRRGLGPRARRGAAGRRVSRAWGVPQRRQNLAVADSDSPQLTHGWTTPAVRPGRRAWSTTSRLDSAHRASRPPCGAAGRPRNGNPLAGPLDRPLRLSGHCGSRRRRGARSRQRAPPASRSIARPRHPPCGSGATICHTGWGRRHRPPGPVRASGLGRRRPAPWPPPQRLGRRGASAAGAGASAPVAAAAAGASDLLRRVLALVGIELGIEALAGAEPLQEPAGLGGGLLVDA